MIAVASITNLYRAMWYQGRAKRRLFCCACLLLFSAEMLKLAIPWLAGRGIDTLQQQGFAGLAIAALWLCAMFGTLLASWVMYGPGRVMERSFALEVRLRHTDDLLDRLLHAPLGWHETRHTGELSDRVAKATNALFCFAQEQYIYLKCLVMLAGPLVALWLISAKVGLAALAGYATILVASMRMDRRLIRYANEENEAERQLGSLFVDAMSNVLSVFALRRREGVKAMVLCRLRDVFAPVRRIIVWNEVKWAAIDLFSNLLWCMLIAVYVWEASVMSQARMVPDAHAAIALGGLFMVYQYAKQIDSVISEVAFHFSSVARHRADYASQEPLMCAPQEARDDIAPQASSWSSLHIVALDFAYSGPDVGNKREAALRQLSLTLQRGMRYGLVGASGSGKSTLLRLLAGLDAPLRGSIGADGESWNTQRLRRESTLVPQSAEMFCGTVRANLELGHPVDEERLWESLSLVGANAFLTSDDNAVATMPSAMPKAVSNTALDAAVGEAGSNWSVGQVQRLALARGVLSAVSSSLVLLDEPTSSLDAATERQVFAGLLHGFDGACVLASIHRLQLLDLVDEIIVMDEGRVIDVGSHAVLLQRCLPFRRLIEAQAGAKPVEIAESAATSREILHAA